MTDTRPMPKTSGVSSVFALAGAAAAIAEPADDVAEEPTPEATVPAVAPAPVPAAGSTLNWKAPAAKRPMKSAGPEIMPRAGMEPAERRAAILNHLAQHGRASAQAMSDVLDIPRGTVTYDLMQLGKAEQVEQVGKEGKAPIYALAKRRTAPAKKAKAEEAKPPAKTVTAVVPVAADVTAFRGGLFSDGTVLLEGTRGRLEMSALEARDALRWLTRVDAALQEAA